ncbi:hypothetical protein D3C76_1371580 [compost metagenome]
MSFHNKGVEVMYNRKKPLEEIPQADAAIWECTSETCKGWMRDNFAFDSVPTCPICASEMVSTTRMLPLLENSNSNMKTMSKGTRI